MKRTTLSMIIAAAAVMAAATTASAQNMKAEIPFPFHAAGARMQPGTYWVSLGHLGGGAATVQFYSVDERRSVMAVPHLTSQPGVPRSSEITLSFACTDGNCVLSSLRDDSATVYGFAVGKTSPATRIATVVLRPDRAE